MQITTKFKQQLKAKAHGLKPIISIGLNGFTDNIKNEIDRMLTDDELIKIRIQQSDRLERKRIFADICEAVTAVPVQLIGGIGVIYRKMK